MGVDETSLRYLLDLHDEEIFYEGGFVARFRVFRTNTSREKPHGISYSFTLHAPDGRRLMGYDNAHGVKHQGGRFRKSPVAYDHWHRDETDQGRPYGFVSAEQLVADFF